MRVIIVADHGVAEGGAPQVAIASARALAEAGLEVIYLQGVGGAGDAALDGLPNLSRESLGGADIWTKPRLVAARDGIWNAAAYRALTARLAELAGPETIVHVHQWTKFFSPAVLPAILRAGLPLAISLHDYFLTCPTGLMFRFDRQEPCALTPLSPACCAAPCDPKGRAFKAIRLLRGWVTRRALQHRPFTAIHVSEQGRRTIGAHLPPSARQVVLENPIACIDRGLRPLPAAPKLVYCGRLTAEKGVEAFARAARAAGLPALFLGEGPMRDAIRAIHPEAEISGWLDRETVLNRLAGEALALVVPSLWPETGPMVAAEALSLGVPVIVSDRAGAAGRVAHGVDGFVVPPEESALDAAISELRQENRAATMGEAAYRRFWADPPVPASHARRLVAIYRGMLGSA